MESVWTRWVNRFCDFLSSFVGVGAFDWAHRQSFRSDVYGLSPCRISIRCLWVCKLVCCCWIVYMWGFYTFSVDWISVTAVLIEARSHAVLDREIIQRGTYDRTLHVWLIQSRYTNREAAHHFVDFSLQSFPEMTKDVETPEAPPQAWRHAKLPYFSTWSLSTHRSLQQRCISSASHQSSSPATSSTPSKLFKMPQHHGCDLQSSTRPNAWSPRCQELSQISNPSSTLTCPATTSQRFRSILSWCTVLRRSSWTTILCALCRRWSGVWLHWRS